MRYMVGIGIALLAVVLCAPLDAATLRVGSRGTVEVVVPAAQYINVFSGGNFSGSGGSTRVSKQVGGPSTNAPRQFEMETNGDVRDEEVSFGPYTNSTRIRIEAGVDGAFYSVGALAATLPVLANSARPTRTQLAPATYNTTSTLLTSDLMGGLITSTHTAGVTVPLTLPTGTLADAASGLQIGQAFSWVLINLSAAAIDTITLTAGSGHTIVGSVLIPSAHISTGGLNGTNSARFLTRKTAPNTFVTYRQ